MLSIFNVAMIAMDVMSCVALGSLIISQLLCHDSKVVDCESYHLHIDLPFFSTTHTLLHHSCGKEVVK